MSIENGERFIRLLEQDALLRERTLACVRETNGVERVSADAGASCRAYEVIAAMLRRMDDSRSETR